MPIFEYKCKDCGRKFEFYHKAKEVPACPACGSKNLSKLFSTFCAHVKGGSALGGGSGSSCSTCSGGTCSTCK